MLLGNGSKWGIDIQYETQDKPDGVARAFIIGEEYLGNSNVALILGDNLYHGNQLIPQLRSKFSIRGCNSFCLLLMILKDME